MTSITKPLSFIKGFLNKGHSRSVKAKKNILASLFIKGGGIAISIILVPLTINYISPSGYGIWLTLSAIVGWFSFFDIGLTQGLRNKFAEARAKGDNVTAQAYVSTTYAILGIIFACIWVLFIIANQFLDWSKILNVPGTMRSEISIVAVIVFTYFCLNFVLRVITTILIASQQPAKSSLIDFLGQILSLLIVFILVKTTKGSLVNLGVALCLAPLVVLVGAHIVFFRGSYKQFRPTLSRVNFSYARGLFNLGLIFFVIQFAGVVQFESANLIITRNFGPTEVTSYNIVYKYFGVMNMLFAIFLTPFWSATTEAYLKNEIQWIRNGIKKYNILNLVLVGVGVIMLLLSTTVYNLWLGHGKVNISFSLSFWGFIFFNVSMFGGKYVSFLNGISALRLQFWACVISPFLYILVSLILIKYYHMGVYALFVASIIANFNSYLLAPIQYFQIIVKKKKGAWIK